MYRFQFLHSRTNIYFSFFQMIIILVGVKWHLIMVLIGSSLLANGAEPLISVLAICKSSWGSVFKSLAQFLIGQSVFSL